MHSMYFSSLQSSLKDESHHHYTNIHWKDEADPCDVVSPALLDLQKKVALISKELEENMLRLQQ